MKLIWELYDYCKGKGLLSEELSRQVEECLDLEFSVQHVGTGDDWESDSWHEDAVLHPRGHYYRPPGPEPYEELAEQAAGKLPPQPSKAGRGGKRGKAGKPVKGGKVRKRVLGGKPRQPVKLEELAKLMRRHYEDALKLEDPPLKGLEGLLAAGGLSVPAFSPQWPWFEQAVRSLAQLDEAEIKQAMQAMFADYEHYRLRILALDDLLEDDGVFNYFDDCEGPAVDALAELVFASEPLMQHKRL